jgi:hypothetical protein
MNKDWKTNRAEAAMKEGTDKIMKAAQALAKSGKETLFPEKLEEANQILEKVGTPDWDSLNDSNLDTPLTAWDEPKSEIKSFEVCLGVGMNQFFPEYIKITF